MTNETKSGRGRPQGRSTAQFQCVSFLTPEGLKSRLDALIRDGVIMHYWFVCHAPDTDSKKEHQHLRMIPPSGRAVDWHEIASGITESVPLEPLPRRLVIDAKSVNDKWEDGLLYARHDSRYLSVKGYVRNQVDIPRAEFYTDSDDWLDSVWAAADEFKPEPKKLTRADLLDAVLKDPWAYHRQELLILGFRNGLTRGDVEMLDEIAKNARQQARHADKEQKAKEDTCTPFQPLLIP